MLLDSNFDVIQKVAHREVSRSIKDSRKKVFAVVVDGAAISSIAAACDESGVQYLAATTFSGVEDAKVSLVSL